MRKKLGVGFLGIMASLSQANSFGEAKDFVVKSLGLGQESVLNEKNYRERFHRRSPEGCEMEFTFNREQGAAGSTRDYFWVQVTRGEKTLQAHFFTPDAKLHWDRDGSGEALAFTNRYEKEYDCDDGLCGEETWLDQRFSRERIRIEDIVRQDDGEYLVESIECRL